MYRLNRFFSSNIQNIVSSIEKLTLLEVSELNSLLKTRLNIQESVAVPVAASVVEEQPKVAQKLSFKVVLGAFDPNLKTKLIKEIKQMNPEMNLVQAKALVEGAPKVLKEDCPKLEAESLKTCLEAVGGKVLLE